MEKTKQKEGVKTDISFSPELLLKVLHESYYDRLLYYAWTIIHDQEVAKDMVQDAFLSYWNEHLHVSVNPIQIKNFLYVNVKNACLKYIRHYKVVDKYLEGQDLNAVNEESALNKIVEAEVIGEIHAALNSLPESSRRISKMAYLEGLKNQEISKKLGISVNTVKTQKKRALQFLRLRLKPETFLTLLILWKINF